jgi:hypothetical protein
MEITAGRSPGDCTPHVPVKDGRRPGRLARGAPWRRRPRALLLGDVERRQEPRSDHDRGPVQATR